MIAILAIFAVGLLLSLLAGVATLAVLRPQGRWLTVETVPLGVATLITLLYLVGFLIPINVATLVIVAILVVALAVAVILRRRPRGDNGATGEPLVRAFRPDRADGVAWVAGLGLTGLLLYPTMRLGFPTTIARSNNDGWSYAGFVDWLSSHSLADGRAPSLAEPLNNVAYFQLKDGFGCGFEMIATMVRTIAGREPFEVVGIVNALGAVVATCGWLLLWRELGGRRTATASLIGVVCAMSPPLVLAFTENYSPHFFGLCLLPFGVAMVIRYMDAPNTANLVTAVLGLLAVVGTYPALIPWLAMAVAAIVLVALARARRGGDGTMSVGRTLRALGLLVAGCVVVGPFQARQTWLFATIHDANSGFATYPEYTDLGYASFGLGTTTHFAQVVGSPLSWNATLTTLLVVGVLTAAVVIAIGTRTHLRTVALLGGVSIAFLVVFGRFASLEAQAYGMFKATLTTGTVFTGLAMILLVGLGATRTGRWGLLAAVGWATIWFAVSVENVEQSFRGASGFRAAEVELGRELDRLPRDTSVLAGGGAEEVGSFQLRMMSAYFGTVGDDDLDMQGLGTTSSYVAGGGGPDAIPAEPWSYVIESAVVPSPMLIRGRVVWQNSGYRLIAAPPVDVTRYGTGWLASEQDAGGGFAWVTRPVQFVVSNRGSSPRTVRLRMRLQSLAAPLPVTFAGGERPVRLTAAPDRQDEVVVPVEVPARGTRVVTMEVPAANPAAPSDPRRVRVQAVGVG